MQRIPQNLDIRLYMKIKGIHIVLVLLGFTMLFSCAKDEISTGEILVEGGDTYQFINKYTAGSIQNRVCISSEFYTMCIYIPFNNKEV